MFFASCLFQFELKEIKRRQEDEERRRQEEIAKHAPVQSQPQQQQQDRPDTAGGERSETGSMKSASKSPRKWASLFSGFFPRSYKASNKDLRIGRYIYVELKNQVKA